MQWRNLSRVLSYCPIITCYIFAAFLHVFEFDNLLCNVRCIQFGLLYVQGHVEDRTMMSSIVLMLGSKAALITHPKQQGYCLGS
ncbi:hypothetical protein YC2023_055784 [Brassica napus]